MRGVVVCALVAILGAAPLPEARAGDPVIPEAARQVALFKLRVRQYIEGARSVTEKCAWCSGTGTLTLGGGKKIDCNGCGHHGFNVNDGAARKWFSSFKSPAWRAQPGAAEAVEAYAARLQKNPEEAPAVGAAVMESVEMLDATHAEVVIRTEGGMKPLVRWIKADDPKDPNVKWWLWTRDVDGVWPGDPSTIPPAKPMDLGADELTAPLEVLPADALNPLRTRLRAEGVVSALVVAHHAGAMLVLTMRAAAAKSEPELQKIIAGDIVATCRAALGSDPATTQVALRFLAHFRDPYGALKWRVYDIAGITRVDYGKIHFDRLEADEALALFSHAHIAHEDGKVWFKD